ncbi:hypothetical protein [Dyadobacter sp. CY347]|uniref:hypothetical protein n=1 Tax=Dyadobacter sp. CY347 TaxID=2909336 RepID=UPI001F16A2C3|nr:hypothetical protein [Dyadobacter sp. CY347]MCF2487401.1 hypothetical protein [Dyadobacter sp. CY347]
MLDRTMTVAPVHGITTTKPSFQAKFVLYLLLAAGILIRVFHYIDNRSLWEDEVFLASSLIHMDFKALAWQPLEYMQRAPLGFLMLERLVVILWDNKEASLRLVPFLSGIASLLLVVRVAHFFLRSQAAFLATVAMFALAPPLVYHAVEAKQYGVELLATLLGLYLYTLNFQTRAVPRLVLWGIAGAVILWFSFSSLFVFFGIAAAVGLRDLYRKDWKMFWLHMIPFSLWLASFLIQYVLFISRFPQEEWLVQFWRNRQAFMPLFPRTISDLGWPIAQIYALIRYPMGLSWLELDYTVPYSQPLRVLARFPFIAVAMGLAGLWRVFKLEKGTLLLWSMPVLLALVASSVELYPVKERMAVFLAPILLMVVGKGIEHLQQRSGSSLATKLIVLLLIAAPALNSFAQVINPDLFGDYKKSRQREAMQYLKQHYRPGDIVYVFWNNLPSYKFYEEVYGLNFNVIYGSDMRQQSTDFESYFKKMEAEVSVLKDHKRIWYVYKPYNSLKLGDIENEPKWYYHNVDANKNVLSYMSRFGKATQAFPSASLATDVKLVLFEKE